MGPLCACSFANVSEHIHLSYLMQWISLHLWGAFLVCKPPPPQKKRYPAPLCTFKSQMAFDPSLSLPAPICLCYLSLLCCGVCLHSHPLLQTHSLYIFYRHEPSGASRGCKDGGVSEASPMRATSMHR